MTLPVPLEPTRLALATINQLHDFTERWLENRRLSDNTREAYRRDIREYLDWCQKNELPPLEVQFTHLNTYGRWLEQTPGPWTGKPPAAATVARKLSAISSWYAFLTSLGALPRNPVAAADRPRLERGESKTTGFTEAEASAMVRAARVDDWLAPGGTYALARFMVDIGARVSEVCGVDLEDFSYDSGHRTVKLKMKGEKTRTRSVPPALGAGVDKYLEERAALEGRTPTVGPLFVRRDAKRITRQEVGRFVRRIARAAGLPNADRITPHSFRHGWATIARERGADLETRQHALGHVDARTTQGYDRRRFSLDRDPSYLVAAAVEG